MYMDSDENISSSPQNDKFLNELTMKLLTNKTNYAKYLTKTDNEKYEEHQEFIQDCKNFSPEILDITKKLCKNPEEDFGSDVKDAFNEYAHVLIRYLEVKERSDELQKEYDTIFPYSMNEESNKVPVHGTMDIFVQKNV